MKKLTKVLILCFTLVLFSSIFYLSYNARNYDQYNEFNFYKSQLTISENSVKERLSYFADQPYHTLYRNFQNSLFLNEAESYGSLNFIVPESVICSAGKPYFKDSLNKLFLYENNRFIESQLSYTESNEYGCGFGEYFGFEKNKGYIIEARYSLKPENVFEIKGDYYTKFIVYSKNKHPALTIGENFFIDSSSTKNQEIVFKKYYASKENVIVYIPISKDTIASGIKIIKQNNFKFDNSWVVQLLTFLLFFSQPIILFVIWWFFGKQKTEPNIPERLSVYPKERKPWQVASFFNLFTSFQGKNLFSSLIMDLYQRRVLDIKTEGKETYLKIKQEKDNEKLDDVETIFIKLLNLIKEHAPKKYVSEGYFNISKASRSFAVSTSTEIRKFYTELMELIKEKEKEYYSKAGIATFFIADFALCFISVMINNFWLTLTVFLEGFVSLLVILSSDVLIKFKKDYYSEYLNWRSFRRYLKDSYTIKAYRHKGVVVWQKYLVYASALGVAEKVIKELKAENLITEKEFNTYHAVPVISQGFSTSFGGANGGVAGGGFSGAGAGGIGGGGGGGR